LLNLEIQFRKNLSAEELALAVDRLEEKIRSQHPEVKHIFIEQNSSALPHLASSRWG
jgi:divalent metal cation (Fe/Co/Zn/Cd) transporter